MKPAIGERLVEAARMCTSEAILISPFVKVEALKRILDQLPAQVPVTVIARWIPSEIAAGVCDLEIFDLIISRKNSNLLVHSMLHAKFYRFGSTVFIGSANLTSKALGWAHPSNIELLTVAPDQERDFLWLEKHLKETAVHVDARYRDEIAKMVELLTEQHPFYANLFQAHMPTPNALWLPKCRDPKRLWAVYSSPEDARRRTVESAYQAACEDLWAIGVSEGLSYTEFASAVASALRALPIVAEISERAILGLGQDEAIQLISRHKHSVRSAEEHWEILCGWLLEFFPELYRRDVSPDKFIISKVVG
jgi:phosphatidylserine/phosphatidylglycerophosphate/cardiolipin synthase-like enzyme